MFLEVRDVLMDGPAILADPRNHLLQVANRDVVGDVERVASLLPLIPKVNVVV